MARTATLIVLTDSEERELKAIVRAPTSEQRLVRRSPAILLAGQGRGTLAIASELGTTAAWVSQWRQRYARARLAGQVDQPRPGPPARYDANTEKRVLAQLDEPPPAGWAHWTGPTLAAALGDVSDDQVWRVLRRHGISLARRRSWCISTDPQFAAKAADIVGLYLDPPENAVVLAVDEKPHIQALEREQGWLKLPNGRALTGFNHEYERHGTTTLFAALEIATDQVQAGHYQRRRRVEFLDFMNQVVAAHPHQAIHVVLDNLNTHKPKRDRWLARHPNVREVHQVGPKKYYSQLCKSVLEHEQPGELRGRQSVDGLARVAGQPPQAAPGADLQAQQRPARVRLDGPSRRDFREGPPCPGHPG
jgi:transposase